VAEGAGDVARDLQRPPLGELPLPSEYLREVLALDELERAVVELPLAVEAELHAAHDVLVLEVPREFRLALEAAEEAGVAGQGGRQDLERHELARGHQARLVDDAHSAFADLRDHLVAADDVRLARLDAGDAHHLLALLAGDDLLRDEDVGQRELHPQLGGRLLRGDHFAQLLGREIALLDAEVAEDGVFLARHLLQAPSRDRGPSPEAPAPRAAEAAAGGASSPVVILHCGPTVVKLQREGKSVGAVRGPRPRCAGTAAGMARNGGPSESRRATLSRGRAPSRRAPLR
jgi:hypothetical protein